MITRNCAQGQHHRCHQHDCRCPHHDDAGLEAGIPIGIKLPLLWGSAEAEIPVPA